MASLDPLAHLLKVTGDAVAEVLDAYKEYYSPVVFSNYHHVIKDTKALFELVQKLETEYTIGQFRTTSPRARKNITEVLNECGRLAKLLYTQTERKNLRDDASTSREIQTYCAEIGFFLGTYGRGREEPTSGASRAEQNELHWLRRRLEEAETEIASLRSIVDEQVHSRSEDAGEQWPSDCDCAAKLLHIKRLHKEIASLGLRRPREHSLESWEELKGELPHMLDHIRGINKQLKWIDDADSPTSPATSRPNTVHCRNQYEPQSFFNQSASEHGRQRAPSPTGSNVSISRDSISANHKSRRTRTNATGYFSNQGTHRMS